jgi:hypothetical protein
MFGHVELHVSLVESAAFMTSGMTQFSVISDTNDSYSVWPAGVILNESFIAFESLFSKGLFSIS